MTPEVFVMAIKQDLINVKLNCHIHALLFDNLSCKCNRTKTEKFVSVHGVWFGTSLQTQYSQDLFQVSNNSQAPKSLAQVKSRIEREGSLYLIYCLFTFVLKGLLNQSWSLLTLAALPAQVR